MASTVNSSRTDDAVTQHEHPEVNEEMVNVSLGRDEEDDIKSVHQRQDSRNANKIPQQHQQQQQQHGPRGNKQRAGDDDAVSDIHSDIEKGPYAFPGDTNHRRATPAAYTAPPDYAPKGYRPATQSMHPRGNLCATVRSYMALGGFPAVLETVVILSVANVFLSMACIAAESSGWFLAYNKLQFNGASLNLIDVNIGWDRFSIEMNGASMMTTRFLDDISKAGYAMGCLSFFGHLASCVISLFTLFVFYNVITNNRVAKLPSGYTHARILSLTLCALSMYLLAFAVIGLPVAIKRDFNKALHADPAIRGFQVRAVWAYGLSMLVTFASMFNGVVILRRAEVIDRTIADFCTSG